MAAEPAPGGSNATKRKWFELYGDAPTPPRASKRPAPVQQASKDDLRNELRTVYAAYDALFKSCKDGQGQENDYLTLLKAGEGSPAAKRLAARLLPRFVRHFPKHARATGDVLTELSRLSISGGSGWVPADTDGPADAPAVAEHHKETRADALAGLPAVVAAAKVETDHQAVIKLVNYAFKQLQSLPAACAPLEQHNGPTPNGQTPGTPGPLFSPATEPLWVLLEAAFTHFPRVVLAACIHALKKPGDNPQLFAVASQFVGVRLLAPLGGDGGGGGADAAGAAGLQTAAGDGGAAPLATAARGSQQHDGSEGGGSGKQHQHQRQPGPSLFRDVMLSEDREQRWFRQHVQQFLQELPTSAGADAVMVLQQLVKELPASPKAQRPPPPPAVTGKHRREGSDEGAAASSAAANGGPLHHRRTFSDAPPSSQQAQQQHHHHHHHCSQLGSPPHKRQALGVGAAPVDPRAQQQQQQPPAAPATLVNHLHNPNPHHQHHHHHHQQQQQQQQQPGGPQGAQVLSPSGGGPRTRRVFEEAPPVQPGWAEGRGEKRGTAVGAGPMDVDGAATKPEATSAAGPPPPFPPPGGNVCLAAACLWMGGLPAYVDEGDVAKECGRQGRVAGVVMPPPVPGQVSVAYVTFTSVRDAMRCYEAMCEAAPWRGCRPLDIRWCSTEAYPPTVPVPPPPKPCNHVWVAGVANIQDEGEVMRCCRDAGVPAPEHLLRVTGRHQGLLMLFSSEAIALSAVQALRAASLRTSGYLPGPPSLALEPLPGAGVGVGALGGPALHAGAGAGLPPHSGEGAGGAAATLAEARSFGLPRAPSSDGSGLPPGPAVAAAAGGGGGGPPQEYVPRLPPPEYHSKTLWVGQIPPAMRDEEVLRVFAACGELVGHKFMRHTNCAFVDYASLASALEARKKLDGARVGPATFRVEFKSEKQWWAGQAARGGGGGGLAPGSITGGGAGPPRAEGGMGRDRDSHHQPYRDQPGPPAGSSNPRGGPPGWGMGPGPPPPPLKPGQLLPPPLGQPLKQPEAPGRPGWAMAAGAAAAAGGPEGLPPPPFGRGQPPPPGWPRHPPAAPPHAPGAVPMAPQSLAQAQEQPARELRRLESTMSLGGLPSLPSGPLPSSSSFGTGGGALPLPPQQGQPHQVQQPQHAPHQAQQQPPWQGKLAKSKVPVCSVACLDPPAAASGSGGGWAAGEPESWPPVLDVGMRADLQFVCSQLYAALAPGERAVRRVVPADPSQQRPFSEFVQYLEGKSRAGVVKLPPLPGVGARLMYLIPPSDTACAALGVRAEPAECMLALVVPNTVK